MTRYQIVYIKRGTPLTYWADSQENARSKAENLRKYGYLVQVWAHTKNGARMTDL